MWFFLTLALAGDFLLMYSFLLDIQSKMYNCAVIKLAFAVGVAVLISQMLSIIHAINSVSFYIPGVVD